MITQNMRSEHQHHVSSSFLFHPFEIAICGYSNSGKTTLISRLINKLSPRYQIAYLKHDVHRFEMDKEGKDTFKVWRAGASDVAISDQTHTALIHKGEPRFFEKKSQFLDSDFLILEGYKNTDLKKIIVVDKDKKILEAIEKQEINNIAAYVGQEAELSGDRPYFHRDDIDGICGFLEAYFQDLVSQAPLYGLVLSGGLSTRMKQDKALLTYHDKPQAEVSYHLLSEILDKVFISSREGQWPRNHFSHLPQIHDRFQGFGPMGGILSAMTAHPGAAWFVVACDLPNLDYRSLKAIIENRNPFKMATCFKNAHQDWPEPLCAIYEPKIKMRLFETLGAGFLCPRKTLINSPIVLMDQIEKSSLDNINSLVEYETTKLKIEKRKNA